MEASSGGLQGRLVLVQEGFLLVGAQLEAAARAGAVDLEPAEDAGLVEGVGAGRDPGVIYAHVIKKDGGYAYAIKSFLGTCVPCIELFFTHMPFHLRSVRI